MAPRVVLLPGDGIGPEIIAPTVEVLAAVGAELEYEQHLFGGASIDAHGTALTDETLDACRNADAVLLAAVGGPKWDTTDPDKPRPEQGLLGLRKGLGLFANLRPVKPLPALYDASPLKRELIERTDLIVIRELTGGIYFGDEDPHRRPRLRRLCVHARGDRADRPRRVQHREIPRHERRQGQRAGDQPAVARGRARRSTPSEFPNIELEHLLVDNAAMKLIAAPRHFEVILTENMFGDILSDEAAMLTGSIGMLPSASLGGDGPGVFEPVHGSAPDIAGTGAANPLAMFLSAAMMLRHGLEMGAQAAAVESAVERALAEGLRTPDLGGTATTSEATQAVLNHL